MRNKISLIIPALSSNFYVEDFLINILYWKKLPNEIFIPDKFSNASSAKIFNKTISGLSKIVKYFI